MSETDYIDATSNYQLHCNATVKKNNNNNNCIAMPELAAVFFFLIIIIIIWENKISIFVRY